MSNAKRRNLGGNHSRGPKRAAPCEQEMAEYAALERLLEEQNSFMRELVHTYVIEPTWGDHELRRRARLIHRFGVAQRHIFDPLQPHMKPNRQFDLEAIADEMAIHFSECRPRPKGH